MRVTDSGMTQYRQKPLKEPEASMLSALERVLLGRLAGGIGIGANAVEPDLPAEAEQEDAC
jgi:hypothetical protein